VNHRRGLTIVEIAIASTIFAVVAYAMMLGASMGMRSEQAVASMVVESRTLHEACEHLEEELSNAAFDRIEHEVDEQGYSSLTFQVPVETETGLDWGVVDRALGASDAERSRVGYSLRYEAVALSDGSRELVRRILDEDGDIVHQDVVVAALATAGPAGFTVEDTGAVWVVTIRHARGQRANAEEVVLHVTSRN
jgi:type II secretory pathway component PulJ